MLPRHCEVRSYATYGYRNHRRHIHRPLALLREGLCADIFTKCVCRQLVDIWRLLHSMSVNCYMAPMFFKNSNLVGLFPSLLAMDQ